MSKVKFCSNTGSRKYSYNYVKSVFEENEYILLSREYKNNTQKLDYICPKGHKSNITFGSFLKGSRCGYCYGNKKYSIEDVEDSFSKRGFKLLDTEYINSRTPMKYSCYKGHTNNISLANLHSGWGCPDCSGNKKKTIDFVKSEFEKEGYTLLSQEYVNSKSKLDYVCPSGHKSSICWGDFRQGYRCILCAGKKKKTIEEVRLYFNSFDYVLLNSEYTNNRGILNYICPEGHRGTTTWHDFSSAGNRCMVCSGKKKKTYAEVKSIFEGEGYSLISKRYINSHGYLKYECPNGHVHKIKLYHFIQGGRCPYCFTSSKRSKAEKSLCDKIKIDFPELRVMTNVRDVIPPKELDIYIPEKNLAIEYCGVYWHSVSAGCGKFYHRDKMMSCYSKGIRLITVFEDEFKRNNKEVLNKIYSIISNPDVKIYTKTESALISDLRYDWLGNKKEYIKMGYYLFGEVGPLSYTVKHGKRTKKFIPEKNKIYDCGRIVYRK